MLKLENIAYKVGEGDVETGILEDVDLTLEPKKLYTITGPNGGGKSTLAKLIMGLYKPTSGKIILDGADITAMSVDERARLGIGYSFQQPPRFKGMTVSDLLSIASRSNPESADASELLLSVGLCPKDYANREVDGTLSGGELKRIELATVLARNLKVAVFDEPEAGIDLWSFKRLAQTFSEMHDRLRTSIVIISHQERILELSDEVILIAQGRVRILPAADRRIEDLLDDDACRCCIETSEGVEEHAEYFRQANA